MHSLVHLDEGATPAVGVEVWDAMDKDVMKIESAALDLYRPRQQARKVVHIPAE